MGTIHLYFSPLWPLFFFLLNFGLAIPAALHALMTKDQVQGAIGWIGVIILSPFVGSILYFCFGVNRVSRRWEKLRQKGYQAASDFFRERPAPLPEQLFNYDTRPGNRLSPFPMTGHNSITMLCGGAETYPAMLDAIRGAKRMIALQSYIFDSGRTADSFIEALTGAAGRGVEIRVLIDGIGAAYSRRSVLRRLRRQGIKTGLFMEYYFGLTLPYANLRNHRKIMVVDGTAAFTGGMNIRDGFALDSNHRKFARDTHFRITGPVVGHLLGVFAQDWHFATGETLPQSAWSQGGDETVAGDAGIRVVPSEPVSEGNANLLTISEALARAQHHVMIQSPYFIPNADLLSMLRLAALRQVQVDIILPRKSNIFFVDNAALAQLETLAASGCRIWHAEPPFDHSKLMMVDGYYAFIGSTNMDTRSLRLNFELDLEVLSPALSGELRAMMEHTIASCTRITRERLQSRPLPLRVFDRLAWLASPYL